MINKQTIKMVKLVLDLIAMRYTLFDAPIV